ncbi:MAG TPA: class I SAM-dependent methyltransferase [Candidatus Rubrimentiphilum sp.]|nr:class I SAM-dependent methyltransferase [Candidatus Rubrimentiphilum sp.]
MNPNPTERFSSRAEAYAANRPSYPSAAIDALLHELPPVQNLWIADAGAGTAIASRLLAERGAHVYAVEPNARMRAQAQAHPLITWIDGTAEETRLAEGAVDIAAAFQAFHWFDPERAIAEFRRISRRRIALLQYERNERDSFTAAYAALVRRYAIDDTENRRLQALENFARLTAPTCHRYEFFYAQEMMLDQMLGRLASSSYLPQEGEAAVELRSEATTIFHRFAGKSRVSMAMICYVLIADA